MPTPEIQPRHFRVRGFSFAGVQSLCMEYLRNAGIGLLPFLFGVTSVAMTRNGNAFTTELAAGSGAMC